MTKSFLLKFFDQSFYLKENFFLTETFFYQNFPNQIFYKELSGYFFYAALPIDIWSMSLLHVTNLRPSPHL